MEIAMRKGNGGVDGGDVENSASQRDWRGVDGNGRNGNGDGRRIVVAWGCGRGQKEGKEQNGGDNGALLSSCALVLALASRNIGLLSSVRSSRHHSRSRWPARLPQGLRISQKQTPLFLSSQAQTRSVIATVQGRREEGEECANF